MARDFDSLAYFSRHYQPLVGARIRSVELINNGGDIYPVLVAELKDGRVARLTITADPEGNGPGYIDGVPEAIPSAKTY